MAESAARHQYRFIIYDQEFSTEDRILTGRDVSSYGGYTPASDFTVIILADRGTQAIGLDEKVELGDSWTPEFRIFKGDRLYRALLNEREIVWGEAEIFATELRRIGEIDDAQDLFLDSEKDRPIPDDGVVRVHKEGVERIRSRDPEDKEIDIILNGEQVTVENGKLTFSELAKLAFPNLFGKELICFTVSFTRGPKRRREGVLLEGDKVRVIEGMVFNVSATDKS